MIDVNPYRCIRTAEEMSITRRVLLQETDILTGACNILRSSEDTSMHTIATRLQGYIADIEHEVRVSSDMALTLEKIAEMYMRAENDTQDFMEQVYIAPVQYSTVMLAAVSSKTRDIFEDF